MGHSFIQFLDKPVHYKMPSSMLLVLILFQIPFLITGQTTFKGIAGTEKVNVSIYYESLCPDSKNFITDNFWGTFRQYISKISVRFIPFGKADIAKDGSMYTCQHREPECYRNKIHACTLERLEDGLLRTVFVLCAMNNSELEGQEFCVNDLIKGGWDDVLKCANGLEGTLLTLEAAEDTRSSTPGPEFVPTIVINNKYSDENQKLALRDFKMVLMKYLYDE